jgi:hypothetical protein
MTMFASVDDLADRLQTDFDTDDRIRATGLLESATGIVQRAARQTFTLAVDDTVTLMPTGTNLLMLPELPVLAINAVTISGDVLDAGGYMFTRSGLLYRVPTTGRWTSLVTVDYDHGYETIPEDIVGIVTEIAARAWQNPRNVLSEQIGTYSARYALDRSSLGLSDGEMLLLRQYRPAPG